MPSCLYKYEIFTKILDWLDSCHRDTNVLFVLTSLYDSQSHTIVQLWELPFSKMPHWMCLYLLTTVLKIILYTIFIKKILRINVWVTKIAQIEKIGLKKI